MFNGPNIFNKFLRSPVKNNQNITMMILVVFIIDASSADILKTSCVSNAVTRLIIAQLCVEDVCRTVR